MTLSCCWLLARHSGHISIPSCLRSGGEGLPQDSQARLRGAPDYYTAHTSSITAEYRFPHPVR